MNLFKIFLRFFKVNFLYSLENVKTKPNILNLLVRNNNSIDISDITLLNNYKIDAILSDKDLNNISNYHLVGNSNQSYFYIHSELKPFLNFINIYLVQQILLCSSPLSQTIFCGEQKETIEFIKFISIQFNSIYEKLGNYLNKELTQKEDINNKLTKCLSYCKLYNKTKLDVNVNLMFYPLKIIKELEKNQKNNILFLLTNKDNIEYNENITNYSIIVSKNALLPIHEKYNKTLIYINEQLFFIYSKSNLSESIQSLQSLSSLKYKIISLQRTYHRREKLVSQLKELELDYEIFYAIDGRLINIDDKGKDIIVRYKDEIYKHNPTIRKNGLKMSYGEFGCALSHIKLYKEMKEYF